MRLRRLGIAALLLSTGTTVGLSGLVLWLRSASGNDFLRRQLDGVVDAAMVEGDFQIGGLETDLFTTLKLTDVSLVDDEGRAVVAVDEALATPRLLSAVTGELAIEELVLTGVAVDLAIDEDGRSDVERLFGIEPSEETEPSAPWEGLPLDVVVERIAVVDASAEVRRAEESVLSLAGLQVQAKASVIGSDVQVEDIAIGGDLAVPELGHVEVEGAVLYRGDSLDLSKVVVSLGEGEVELDGQISGLQGTPELSVTLAAKPFDLAPIDAFANAGLAGVFEGELALSGPLEAVTLAGSLTGTGGEGALTVDIGANLTSAEVPWSGTLEAETLHVEKIVGTVGEEPLVITGVLKASGQGTTWPAGIEVEGDFEGTRVLAYGAEIHDSSAALALRDGVLRWTEVETSGPLGPLEALGSYDFRSAQVQTTVRGRLNLRELESFGATDLGGSARVDLQVRVDASADGSPTSVRGRIVATPFTYGSDIRFERVVADVVVAVRGGDVGVDAVVDASRGEAYGTEIAGYFDETVRVDRVAGVTRATGAGAFGGFAVPGVLDLRVGRAEWAVDLDVNNDMVAEVSASHGRYDLLSSEGSGGRLTVTLADQVARVEARMQSPTEVPNLDTALAFDLRNSTLDAQRLLIQPVPGSVFRAEEPVKLRLAEEGGGVREAVIALSGADGRVVITGDVGLYGGLASTIRVEELDLGVVSTLAELGDPLEGKLTATLALEGPADRAELELSDLLLTGFDGDIDVSGEVSGFGNRLYPRLTATVGGELLASVGGELPVQLDLADARLLPDESVDLDMALRAGRLDRLERWAGNLPPGHASGAVRLSGTLGDADVTGAGVAELAAAGWSRPARVEWSVTRQGESLVYWADVFEGFDRRGSLKGTANTRAEEVFAWALADGPEPAWEDYDLYATALDGEMNLREVPASSLLSLMGSPMDVEGSVGGELSVAGSASRPVAQAHLRWLGGRIGEAELDRASLDLERDGETYLPTLAMQFTEGGSLFMGGSVPLSVDLSKPDWREWQTGELDLSIGGEGLPLGLSSAVDPGIAGARGMVALSGTVEGTLERPEPDLTVELEDGRLDYLPLGLRIRGLSFLGKANERLISLKTLEGHPVPLRRNLKSGLIEVVEEGGGAPFEAKGSMRIEDFSPGAVQGSVTLDNALVSARDDQLLRLSGDIDISQRWPELLVKGRMRVEQGYISLDSASFFDTAPLRLDDNLLVLRSESPLLALRDEEEEDEPPLYQKFDVGIVFDMNRSVEADIVMPFLDDLGALGASITSADVSVRLDGEGRIAMHGGDVALLGEVEVVGGKVRVIQSNFDLESGVISFIGDDFTNPALDLTGSMGVTGGQVDLRVGGTPTAPEIAFSSEDFPDQQQILTILLTGRAPDEGDAGAGAVQAAGGLLLQSVLGGTSLGGFSVEPDGTVSVGVPVAPSVFVRSTFSPQPEIDENNVSVIAEWALARKLVVEAAWGDQHSWGDLFWELRF